MMTIESLDRLTQFKERTEIIDRVRHTIAVQTAIADVWIWDGKDLATWNAELDDVTGIHPVSTSGRFSAADYELNSLENDWRRALDALHRQTVIAVGVARIRWRQTPEQLLAVAGLSAGGTTADEILAEALAWEVAWERIEPAFVPVAGLTLAAFQTQHAAVRALERPLRLAAVERRLRAGEFGLAMARLNDAAVRWYGVASAMFDDPEGRERRLLDGVPTTFVPRYYQAAKRRRKAKREAAAAETAPS